MATKHHLPKIGNIQILRAIAAIAVVASHVVMTGSRHGIHANIMLVFEGRGDLGVYLFFIISGFIMCYTTTRANIKPRIFFLNRLARIYPIYALLLLTFYIISSAGFFNVSIPDVNFSWLAASLFFVSQPFMEKLPLIYVGWTLEYEMMFYLIFAMALFIRSATVRFLVISATVLFLVGVIGVSASAVCFILGIAVFSLTSSQYKRFGLLLMIAATVFLLANGIAFYDIVGWLSLAAITAISIVVPQISLRWLLLLGDASYSIYLTHVFSLPLFFKLVLGGQSEVPPDLVLVGITIGSTILGVCFFILVEKPISKALSEIILWSSLIRKQTKF